jgi:hypothetical protein
LITSSAAASVARSSAQKVLDEVHRDALVEEVEVDCEVAGTIV